MRAKVVLRCRICGKVVVEHDAPHPLAATFSNIKDLELYLEHLKGEHSPGDPEVRKEIERVEEELDRLYRIMEDEAYAPL